MSEGGAAFGLTAEELQPTEAAVSAALREGRPVICIMGHGTFTDGDGHFILLTDYDDGKITIHDPNSRERSERLWTFEEFRGQIRCLWAFSANEQAFPPARDFRLTESLITAADASAPSSPYKERYAPARKQPLPGVSPHPQEGFPRSALKPLLYGPDTGAASGGRCG